MSESNPSPKAVKNQEKMRDDFVRLANRRVNNAIKAITLIGNLANRTNYRFDADDVKRIFGRLNQELKKCRSKFDGTEDPRGGDFSL